MMLADTSFAWTRALLEGAGGSYALVAAAAGAGLVASLVLLSRLHPRPRPRKGVTAPAGGEGASDGEAGTATIEFVLVFPFVLMFALVLLQTTLAMVGNVFVHYAAFAATRAAIVHVPADYGSAEPRNTIYAAPGGEKFDQVHAAAVWAVTPVAGRLDETTAVGEAFAEGLHDLFASQGRASPNWVDNFAAQRLAYATRNTDIALMTTTVGTVSGAVVQDELAGGSYTFGPRDPITVRVTHKLNLAVPYARVFFADGEHDTADGPGGYTTLTARYTLTNEGIDPELPPEPDLPRSPSS